MTKILYIIGLVCCVGLFVSFVALEEADRDARWSSYDYDYDYYDSYDSYGDYSYGGYGSDSYSERENVSFMGGIIGILFCLYFAATYIIGIMKVKRTVAKVFNIVGVSIAGIFIFVNLIPILNPGDAYFDDYGPSWIFLDMFMIPCCIVGLVQAAKYSKELKYGVKPKYQYQPQVPSYNPNHPSAAAVMPGQPQYNAPQQQQYQQAPPQAPPPQYAPPQQQVPQQAPPPPQQQPMAPQTPPPPTTPQAPPPPQTGGSAPIPPAPSVAPAPSVKPVDNDPIIFDDDEGKDGINNIDDL